nr:hypothetical protein [uncultured Fretibacterium sp.]
MTPLRSVLGLLWLAGASAWMLPLPCMNLWRAWGYRSARSGAENGSFAIMGAMKQLCFIASGIVAGLSGFWWEHLYLCLETALTLLLLGVWLIYFEAPIDGLFDADDEEVLSNGEMLVLWYGGLNEIYVRAQDMLYWRRYRCDKRAKVEYSFARTGAWTWDDPELRAAAYYFKAQGVLFCLSLQLWSIATSRISVVIAYLRVIYVPYGRLAYDYYYGPVPTATLFVRIFMALFVCFVFFPFAWSIRREWMARYRDLVRALREGRDPDLSDRAQLAEMRLAVLGWAQEKSLVHYDRNAGSWKLGSGMAQSEGGHLVG